MGKKLVRVFLITMALSVIFTSVAFAQEPLGQEVKKFIGLATGLGIAIAALGGGLGQGIAIAKGLEGIGRNPEAQPKIFIAMIVGLALIESLVIYTLVICFMLFGKL